MLTTNKFKLLICGIGLFVFRGRWQEGKPAASTEGSLEWIVLEKLVDFPLVEDLQVLLPRVMSMKPDDPPFSALYDYDSEDRLRITFGG